MAIYGCSRFNTQALNRAFILPLKLIQRFKNYNRVI